MSKKKEEEYTNDSLERLKRIVNGEREEYSGGSVPPEAIRALGGEYGMRSIRKIPPELIDPWSDDEHAAQPFKPYTAEKLRELADSMGENGQLSPVRLRPSPTAVGRFQTLAGHNRVAAAKLLGWTMIDAIVEAVDDDQARLILVDSNLRQREKLLPSEKAFAYKIRLDAMKRQAGRPNKNNSVQVGQNFEGKTSRELLAANSPDSNTQIQRYIRLTNLLPPLLDMVDSDAMPLTAGVAVSFLSSGAQETLLRVLRSENITAVNRSQAEALKEIREDLDGADAESLILRVFGRGRAAKPPKAPVWKFETSLPSPVVRKYQKDAELLSRVSKTIAEYISEKERG